MPELDDTDLEILSLLADDGRRPFSDIGEAVGLSGPAVSDRVRRLEAAGIIRGFTIEIDRSQLRAGVPLFVRVAVSPADVEALKERVAASEAVEHVFLTAEGEIWFYGRGQTQAVRSWIEGLLEGIDDAAYTVTLIDEVEWTPTVDGVEFALTCAECGNTVDSEGESTRIDGEIYHFCCSSCLARFEERYERHREAA